MAKVVFRKQEGSTARSLGGKPAAIEEKRIKSAGGTRVILNIRMDSDTFDHDLTYAFGRNVAKARRANKKLTGELDSAPAKP